MTNVDDRDDFVTALTKITDEVASKAGADASGFAPGNGGVPLGELLATGAMGAAERFAMLLESEGEELVRIAAERREHLRDIATKVRDCGKSCAEGNRSFIESLTASRGLVDQIAEKFLVQS